jgi:rhodanese-related sulfurtransferase
MSGNPFDGVLPLTLVEAAISAASRVPEMEVTSLAGMLAGDSAQQLVLFDVRQPEEYFVSRIPGAVQLDPGITAEKFLHEFKNVLPGKKAVLYCTVGQRSSLLLQSLHNAVAGSEAAGAYNLRGGIFRWYAEGLPVVNDAGKTGEIHPYSAMWGMLLKKRTPDQPT